MLSDKYNSMFYDEEFLTYRKFIIGVTDGWTDTVMAIA
jgi:hypothetical protein